MTSPILRSHPGDLDFRDRAQAFRAAEEAPFDLIVVGAGITGAGVARAAAARGLRVALVEANDLAAGTSSRSSKMIHGGVRYLAQGDLSLVREAANERQVLRRIAPHLARITRFVLPTRSNRGMAKFRAAMWTFEKIGHVPREERHEVWDAAELARHEPLAATEGTNGGVVYFEFLTDDARLTLANARSAAADGALVLTHAPVKEVVLEGGRAVGVRCEGALEGETLGAVIRGKAIVNAAGPWVDALRALEQGDQGPRLSLTKGIHLVVPHSRLPLSHTVLMSAADKRPVFAVPRGDVSYLGTTDTFYPKTDYWPDIESEDVDYLLDAAAASFTSPRLSASDVVSSWTGIRPLVSQAGKKPSEISRRDELWTGPAGVMSIAGGKLTAYRAMAERVVDRIFEQLGQRGAPAPAEPEPLVGGDFEPASIAGQVPRDRLVDLYGAEAPDVARDGGDLAAEVRQAVVREGALRLEDYWVRRSARAFFDPDAGLSTLTPASHEMARLLGWSEAARLAEVSACQDRHIRSNSLFMRARGERLAREAS
ncbi:MAG: glycerol-3-phosphate dehydrogenase/oxidase [Myxococcota bacterium]|nr:glycerol-3-phosphate dehydrogenase/oxidase [Myxococcota bacterium]